MSQTPQQWFSAALGAPDFLLFEGDEIHPFRADARLWFRACRLHARAVSPDLPGWESRDFADFLEARLPDTLDWAELARVAILHVEVLRAMVRGGHPIAGLATATALGALATATEPLPLLLDLQSELHRDAREPERRHGICSGAVREHVPTTLDLPLLLVSKAGAADPAKDDGVIGRFALGWVPRGEAAGARMGDAVVYRHPALALVQRDGDWLSAEAAALAVAHAQASAWPRDEDLRWLVQRQDEQPLPLLLEGDSAGTAWAIALVWMLHERGWLREDSPFRQPCRALAPSVLRTLAAMAAINPDGTLCGVGGVFHKLIAARDGSLPRIRVVIAATAQEPEIRATYGLALGGPDEIDGLKIFFAATIEDGFRRAVEYLVRAWKGILDYTPEWQRHRAWFPRGWLVEHFENFAEEAQRAGKAGAYWLLEADPFFGKSAFAAQVFRPERPEVAGHFFKRQEAGWSSVGDGLTSVILQLCQRHRLSRPDEADLTEGKIFKTFEETLRKAGASARLRGGFQIVVLDGLDEAEDPTRLVNFLPRELPAGIVVLLSGRPGDKYLGWLREPATREVRRVPLDPNGRSSRAEIFEYLTAQNAARALRLPQEFLGRLTDACECLFGLACRILADATPEDLACWQANPGTVPQGLSGWLREQWRRLLEKARNTGIGEELVRGVFGLLAAAREPLSMEQLLALLRAAHSSGGVALGPLEMFGLLGRHGHAVRETEVCRAVALGQEFFDPLDLSGGVLKARHRFFHTSLPDHLLGTGGNPHVLTSEQVLDLHALLGRGSRALWHTDLPSATADYALQHGLRHLIAARAWAEAAGGVGMRR